MEVRCFSLPPDPGDADKQPRRKVVGDDVEAHLPRQDELEARSAVVHTKRHVMFVHGPQWFESYSENCQLYIFHETQLSCNRKKL